MHRFSSFQFLERNRFFLSWSTQSFTHNKAVRVCYNPACYLACSIGLPSLSLFVFIFQRTSYLITHHCQIFSYRILCQECLDCFSLVPGQAHIVLVLPQCYFMDDNMPSMCKGLHGRNKNVPATALNYLPLPPMIRSPIILSASVQVISLFRKDLNKSQ